MTISPKTDFTSADLSNAKNVDKVEFEGDLYFPVFRDRKAHHDPSGAGFAKQVATLMAGDATGSALDKASGAFADAAGGDGVGQKHKMNVLHTKAAQF